MTPYSTTYSVSDVSKMMKVNEETVRRWIRDKKLPAKTGVGRSGHSIYLKDVVSFANQASQTHLEALSYWLKENHIAYTPEWDLREETVYCKKVPSSIEKLPPFIANAVVAASPTIGESYCASEITRIKLDNEERYMSYTDLITPLLPSNAKDNIEETDRNTKIESALSNKTNVSDPKTNFKLKIIEEQKSLIKLRQKLAQIQAEITIAEEQIEYYNLLLQQQEKD